jgi:uncharacterized protein (TIGR00661 family)
MKSIVFYISNHGFGHATRCLALIENIIEIDSSIRITIKTSEKQLDFCRRYLSSHCRYSNLYYKEKNNDVGLMLEKGSINVDKDILHKKLINWLNAWDQYINEEIRYYKKNKVDLIVSDITAQPFVIGKIVDVRTLAISNFTWYEMYRYFYGDDDPVVVKLYKAYNMVENAFLYPLHNITYIPFKNYIKIGFVARKFDSCKVKQIRAQFLKKQYKRLIFVSLGRSAILNEKIILPDDENFYIYTDGLELIGKNSYKIPLSLLNTHEYIAASDLIITKAGWSTVSEAVISRIPILVIDRQIIEDKNIINGLIKMGVAKEIKIEALYNILKQLKFEEIIGRLNMNYDHNNIDIENRSFEIANKILNLIS